MPEQPNPKFRPAHPKLRDYHQNFRDAREHLRPAISTLAAPAGAAEPPAAAGVPPYAELDVATNFSFLRGASHADELVARAAELGYRAIGVTDINTLSGAVRMYEAARQANLKLLVGARLHLTEGPDVLVWPIDRAGYGRLCRMLTEGKRRTEKGQCLLTLDDVLKHQEGWHAAVSTEGDALDNIEQMLVPLREAMGRRLSLATSFLHGGDDQRRIEELDLLGRRFDVPLVATNHAHYHDPARRMLHDVLTCIRHGCTIPEAGFRLFPNAERYLKSPAQMHRLFAAFPSAIRRGLQIAEQCTFQLRELRYEYPAEIVPAGRTPVEHLADLTWAGAASRYPDGVPAKVRDLITHELTLIENLRYEAYFLTVYDLVTFARSRGILCQGRGSAANSAVCYCIGVTSVDPSRIDLLFERFVSAARNEPPDIDVDFEHERREEVLQYIYDKYGRERAGMTAEVITYRGRSAIRDVGKALGLSLDMVDQMARKLDWWDRGVLPDERLRECGLDPADRTVRLVIDLATQILGFPRHLSQHVGGMIMTRGPLCELVPIENAAMPNRTVIEWDKDDIDAIGMLKVDCLGLGMLTCISKCLNTINVARPEIQNSNDESNTEGSAAKTRSGEETTDAMQNPKSKIQNGFRLRGESSPNPQSAIRNPQWSGLHGNSSPNPKSKIQNPKSPSPLQLHTIPPEDPLVYDMICRADTIGVFQIESRAQMSMLPRLRPRCFYDLVIEVAIVRPGPIQGNMVHPYLRRRNGEEQVNYPSEALRQVLAKTLGVPLFQEQAMRVAMVGAGFSAEEADKLRRAMAAWRRGGAIEALHRKIVEGMLANGYTHEFAEQCFMQIRGFGEYGFPESHAASFALLVYASAWLKLYYPAHFAAALLNSQPMGFYAPAQIVRDARDHGVEVRAVDVNFSEWDCVLEGWGDDHSPPSRLRLGFRMLKGIRQAHARKIVAARQRAGRFVSVAQIHQASGVPVSTLRALAEADAFSSLGLSRRKALWEILPLKDESAPLFERIDGLMAQEHCGLNPIPVPALRSAIHTPQSEIILPPMSTGQEVMADYATAGLSLKQHPVAIVRDELTERGIVRACEIRKTPNGRWVRAAGMVLIRQRPSTASGILFVTIEDETGIVNLIIRPSIYDRYRAVARHAGLLKVEGNIERQGDVVHLMALRLEDLSCLLAGYSFTSRDFH